jgi:D-inositol-3-phosphate glycosyltransferase
MRILMVEHSGRSGMYAYTYALCTGLCGNGADVTVLTSSAWPKEQKPYNIERLFVEIPLIKGNSSRLFWAADRFYRNLTNILRRNRFVLERDYDVIHIQGAALPVFDQYLLKPLSKKLPVVLTVHDCMPHFERFVSRESFMRKNLQIPHRLIVHYENGSEQLVKHWGINKDMIDVIPHGIVPVKNSLQKMDARKKLGIPENKKVLLFFGSIRENKGLNILLKSMKEVVSQNSDVLLVIAGAVPRDTSFQPYQDIIEKNNLSQNIRKIIEFIPDEEVDYYFAACDDVVLPYIRFESQSGVLLRAYAHKKPVIVSDIGAMGELVRSDQVGIAVQPNDEKSLSSAINEILKNQNKFSSFYTSRLQAKYNWKHISKLTLQSYEKAIAQRTNKLG